jgi:hypothetical protein
VGSCSAPDSLYYYGGGREVFDCAAGMFLSYSQGSGFFLASRARLFVYLLLQFAFACWEVMAKSWAITSTQHA